MTLRAARTAPARNTGVCWGGGGCAQTLSDLGADAVARVCVDLRFCRLSHNPAFGAARHVVLLGVHHLARYLDDRGLPAVIAAGWPPRATTTLYNFEHVDVPTNATSPHSGARPLRRPRARNTNCAAGARGGVGVGDAARIRVTKRLLWRSDETRSVRCRAE